MAADRASLLQSIATTIADYRAGQIAPATPAHVDRWISQFDPVVQLDMLMELDHVLGNTYVPNAQFTSFLKRLSTDANLAGADPRAFWRSANLLDIQRGGRSQTEILGLFSGILSASFGFMAAACGSAGGPYVYLDDASFTGNRIRDDVIAWLPSAPARLTLHVIVMASHEGGYYARDQINKAFKDAGKVLDMHWWRGLELENRKSRAVDADVLWPKSIPADQAVQDYIQTFKYAPTPRTGTSLGRAKIFASDAGRNLLEQELLKAGAQIRLDSPYLNKYQRPLGNMPLETLGFGSTLVTFRNCPNNCPLAFWAGDPWYPLFPRKTN